ncbi:hypothetical protein DFJ73DRAFT_900484, partial [Zopfochytrium polystomum]
LKFLPARVQRICRKDAPPVKLPYVETDAAGIAAVIDISGFSALSARLQEVHGLDGGALLRDAINSPFDKIIRAVHSRSGEIVKFAGDAAVVCWSEPQATSLRRQHLLLESFFCCLELLREFKEKMVQPSESDSIGIHIGVGYGTVNHIHLGENSGGPSAAAARREYLIGGSAVFVAGNLLSCGNRGQVVFHDSYWNNLGLAISDVTLKQALKQVIVDSLGDTMQNYVVIEGGDLVSKGFLQEANRIQPIEKDESTSQSVDGDLNQLAALQYVETSVVHYLMAESSSKQASEKDGNVQDYQSGRADRYSDLRNVAVLFIRFPNVHLELPLGNVDHEDHNQADGVLSPLSAAQFLTEAVLRSAHHHGGSLRQISFDDKGFTALAVWGLRGFAHHRAESRYALKASMQVAQVIERKRRSVRNASATALDGVSIGVASGVVYAGLIGNELRMDGTVLGTAVNLAARLMCLARQFDAVEVLPTRVFICCDEASFEESRHWFKFDTSLPSAKLKGWNEPIPVFMPLSEMDNWQKSTINKSSSRLVGRTGEVEMIEQSINKWALGEPNQIAFFVGKSGMGKSALVEHMFRLVSTSAEWVCCSYAFLGSLLRNFAAELREKGVQPQELAAFAEASNRSTNESELSVATTEPAALTTSTSFTDSDASYLQELLTALQCSSRTLAAISTIPGLWKSKSSDRRASIASLRTILAPLMVQMFRAIENLGFKISLFCDDAQRKNKRRMGPSGTL